MYIYTAALRVEQGCIPSSQCALTMNSMLVSSKVMVPARVRILTTVPWMEFSSWTRATAPTCSASCALLPPSTYRR